MAWVWLDRLRIATRVTFIAWTEEAEALASTVSAGAGFCPQELSARAATPTPAIIQVRFTWHLDSMGPRTEELLRNSLYVLADNSLTLLELSPLLKPHYFVMLGLCVVE